MSKKVMHIVSTGKLSGAEKVVSDICSNLTKNFNPIIICSGEELKNYYENKGIESYIFNISKLNPIQIIKLRNFVKKNNIDIIHAHDIKPSIAGYLCSMNIPVISHLHGTYPWLQRNGMMKKIDAFFRTKYRINLACSTEVKNYYLTFNKNIKNDKIIVLNNAFNFKEFKKIKITPKEVIKTHLLITKDEFIFGYVGRLIPLKGLDLLIDSFSEIIKENFNCKLVIVGDGNEKSILQNKVINLGLSEKIIFTGFKDNVYEYINIFDCFVLSSIREGLPMVILESIAMKKPIISTPVAGVKELINSDDYGIVLNKRTKENMIIAMKDILINTYKFQIKTETIYKKLKKDYDISNYIKKLETLYNSLS